ncbi:hypothetical protein NMB32_05215 [Stenotrophomonas sp. CD2]|nr:hypothetical protein NMB32_05215 [Stenotrophomonas sp. CD2]
MRRTCAGYSRCASRRSRPHWPPSRTAGCTRRPHAVPVQPGCRPQPGDQRRHPAAAEAQVSRDQIHLFLVLGGGWQASAAAPNASTAAK